MFVANTDGVFGRDREMIMTQTRANTPLTFTESSYWWLWIPVIGWIPFSIPLVIPLGPIMLGFSLSNKMRFVWEAANHNGNSLPDGTGALVGSTSTLGYNTVWRTYGAAKKMVTEEAGGDRQKIPGWSAFLLPFYILCPALVYMPLIRAMRRHWEWHLQQKQAAAPSTASQPAKAFTATHSPGAAPQAEAVSSHISVACPCGKRFRVLSRFAGKTAKCTACGGPILIPS